MVTRQICENFLQGSSCLTVGQMAIQRTLLSGILFCITKSSIVMGQLLLCTRFSPTRREPWQCISPLTSGTSGSGSRTCSPADLLVYVLDAERSHRPWCLTPFAELLLPGRDLECELCPKGSGFELQGGLHNLTFPEAVAQGVEHGPSVFSDESSYHF